MGAFWSPDPAGIRTAEPKDPANWNRYAYVRGAPASLIDRRPKPQRLHVSASNPPPLNLWQPPPLLSDLHETDSNTGYGMGWKLQAGSITPIWTSLKVLVSLPLAHVRGYYRTRWLPNAA